MILQDVKTTSFMQAADIFQKSKVAVKPTLQLKIDPNVKINDEWVEKLRKITDNQHFKIIALYNDDEILYTDPNVEFISNGVNFTKLTNYIMGTGSL